MLPEIIDSPAITEELFVSNDRVVTDFDFSFLRYGQNVSPSLVSSILTKRLELQNELVRESMSTPEDCEHRLEFVATIAGIAFINDSKSTNVNSVWYSLSTMPDNVVLIMGGVDKGNDYEAMRELVKQKVSAIVCLGKDTRKINIAFGDDVEIIVSTSSMYDAVYMAYHLAMHVYRPGKRKGTVLLSPACASFDLFKSYEDRGRQFRQTVKDL